VEENEYCSTYHSINQVRCVFEKAMVTRHCQCSRSVYFALAEREGYGCNHRQAQQRCEALQKLLRNNARFTLGITTAEGPLPHNKEIRVQVGGMRGIHKLCFPALAEHEVIDDIDATIEAAIARYGSIEALPYDQIIPSVVAFEGRRKRRGRER